ncbi:hypothetical protein [Kribbella swartbergensis]
MSEAADLPDQSQQGTPGQARDTNQAQADDHADRERILSGWADAHAWVTDELAELRNVEHRTAAARRDIEIRRQLDRDDTGQLDPGCTPAKRRW